MVVFINKMAYYGAYLIKTQEIIIFGRRVAADIQGWTEECI